jgi:hypothetical protein
MRSHRPGRSAREIGPRTASATVDGPNVVIRRNDDQGGTISSADEF